MVYDIPYAIWVFPIVLLLLLLLGWLYRYRQIAVRYFNQNLVLSRSKTLYVLKIMAILTAWILATFALMQPKGNAHYLEEKLSKTKPTDVKLRRRAHEVILLIDASASMSVPDSRNGKTRLDYAKDIADQIVSRLNGDSVSLYAFTYDVAQLSPATPDQLYVRLLLRALSINEGDTAGTSLQNAMEEMHKRYLVNPSPKLLSLILLSDGEDNQIQGADGDGELLKTLEAPGASHLRVFTIGMGTAQAVDIPKLTYEGKIIKSALNAPLLQRLAAKGRGTYYEANSYTTVSIADALMEAMAQDSPYISDEEFATTLNLPAEDSVIYDPYFQIPLGLAILLLAFYIFGPNTTRRLGLFVVLLIPVLPLSGTPYDSRVIEAANAVQAGQIEQARSIYTTLLTEPLLPWQKEFIQYDAATALLVGGESGSALLEMSAIPLEGDPYPLLVRRLLTNRAIAYFKEAEKESSDTTESSERALYLLREGLETANTAAQWDCKVIRAQGGTACTSPKDIQELIQLIKVKLSFTLDLYIQKKIQTLSAVDGIALLAAGEEATERELNFLVAHPLSSDLKTHYTALLSHNSTEWQSVWDAVHTQESIYELAKKKHQAALEDMKTGNFESALSNFAESKKELYKALDELLEKDPFQIQLTRLQGLYQFALAQDPPFEASLRALKIEQDQIELKNEQLDPAKIYLDEAIKAQLAEDSLLARFYLEAATGIIARAMPVAQEQASTPLVLLQDAIDLQSHALTLNRLITRMKTRGDLKEKLQDVLGDAQKKVLDSAQKFNVAVLQQESEEFNSTKLSQEERCQAHPWDEALPLYFDGLCLAKKAYLSVNMQEQTISSWRKAEEILKKPKSSFKGGCNGGGSAGGEGDNQQDQPRVQNILKDIQEMDLDDRQEKKTPALQVKGIKPW